jgi:hypothetical protein
MENMNILQNIKEQKKLSKKSKIQKNNFMTRIKAKQTKQILCEQKCGG